MAKTLHTAQLNPNWSTQMKRALIAAFACLAPLAWLPSSHAQTPDRSISTTDRDGPNGEFNLGMRLYIALQYRQVGVAATVFQQAKEQPQMTDGRSTMAAIYAGYGDAVLREKQWDEHLARIREWRASEPDNVQAVLTEGAYWIAYGRFARGGQFAANVPQQAFERMHERMAHAEAALETIRPLSAKNPIWYTEMLTIGLIDGWDMKRRVDLFNDAIRADPYFYASYSRMATSLTPRWGGSLSEYHAFVEGSVSRTRPREGNSYYARLYWNLAEIESDRDPFRDLGIPWQKMKSGFDDLMQRFPDSQWNLHHYAHFACRAGDGKTFNKLRPTLDLRKMNQMSRIWSNAYTLEFCTEQFTQRT
jgi:hypothetical protein